MSTLEDAKIYVNLPKNMQDEDALRFARAVITLYEIVDRLRIPVSVMREVTAELFTGTTIRAFTVDEINTARAPIAAATNAQTIDKSSRLEDGIALSCCGQPCRLAGNLALRGAGSPVTRLAYECVHCFRRLQVVDAWDQPSAEQLAAYDETP